MTNKPICSVLFWKYNLTRHNVLADNGINLFDKCAAGSVHLSTQEEECTSSSWVGSKMYKSSSIANSLKVLTVNKQKRCKIRILKKGNTVKHLKSFRTISSNPPPPTPPPPISFLILCLWYFSCLLMYLEKFAI